MYVAHIVFLLGSKSLDRNPRFPLALPVGQQILSSAPHSDFFMVPDLWTF